MTTEEKASSYAWSKEVKDGKIEVWHFRDEVHEMLVDAYLAGAAEALRSQWRDASKELPEEDEYVLIYGPRGIEAAWWNSHFQVWDDAEGDDYMYDKGKVSHWLPIPPHPDTEEQ